MHILKFFLKFNFITRKKCNIETTGIFSNETLKIGEKLQVYFLEYCNILSSYFFL